MIALKATDVKNNFKSVYTQVFEGEVVMLSEAEYNELAKVRSNLEYLAKLAKSVKGTKMGIPF